MASSPTVQRTADDLAHDASRPSAPIGTETFRKTRPEIVGPEEPELPFPIKMAGTVQKGFGRGGKDLGCPTANLPEESLHTMSAVTTTGVYYGFAQVIPKEGTSIRKEDQQVYPMAMSLGWNPFYKNERLSAEVHIMHEYETDFYGSEMKVMVLGYIRPELDYTTRESLIADIETDKKVAILSLARPAYAKYASDEFFTKIDLD